jgi:hypothetical protein
MADLLLSADLPPEFIYPPEFVRAVDQGIVALEPWEILVGDDLRRRFTGLQDRYPGATYVPLAARVDNDDVACWTSTAPEITIVHDFASPGWERRDKRSWPNFHAWLRQAVEDFIEWGEMEVGH